MELSTPRLLLRECRPQDHPAVHAFASNSEVTRYTVWGPNTPEDTTVFLAAAAVDAQCVPRSRYTLAIADQESDTPVGWIELRITSHPHGRGEMGYVLAPAHRGRGYVTEAGSAMLRFGFSLGLRKISATCDPLNLASARVLQRLGMHREGYLRDHVHVRGQWRDRLLYAAVSTRHTRAAPAMTTRAVPV